MSGLLREKAPLSLGILNLRNRGSMSTNVKLTFADMSIELIGKVRAGCSDVGVIYQKTELKQWE